MPRSPRAQASYISRNMERDAARLMVSLATEIHANLVETTPVDTGWARGNWVPSIGRPVEEPVGSRTDSGSAAYASQGGLFRVIVGYKSPRQGSIWIQNNVPYIGNLNRSHKTAAGFVPRAIDKAILKVGRGRARRVR